MPIKTFVSGEILTASDTNAYLNNGGLVYITSQTIGSAVATQAVSGAFSATYDSYLITVSGGASSVSEYLTLRLGATTNNYRYNFIYGNLGSTVATIGTTVGSNFGYVGWANPSGLSAEIFVGNPFLSMMTFCRASAGLSGNTAGLFSGVQIDTTSFTAFTLGIGSGTMTGGTIRVYGYRQA